MEKKMETLKDKRGKSKPTQSAAARKEEESTRKEFTQVKDKEGRPLPLPERERMLCLLKTRLAYLMADVANSYLVDVDRQLQRVGKCVERSEKQKFRNMADAARRLKLLSKDACRTMVEMENDAYFEDSELIERLMLLMIDRVAGQRERLDMVRNFLLRMRSVLKLY